MARPLNRLTARQAVTLKASGRHADGGGLYLRVTPAGGRSWVFMATSAGKRAEIGLGAVSAVSLSTARQLAASMREAIALGRDPRSALTPSPPVSTVYTAMPRSVAARTATPLLEAARSSWRQAMSAMIVRLETA